MKSTVWDITDKDSAKMIMPNGRCKTKPWKQISEFYRIYKVKRDNK
jgi:hypothetical protein